MTKPNVVLFDCDPLLGRATAMLLARAGASVTPVVDLAELAQRTRDPRYDVAILDVAADGPPLNELLRHVGPPGPRLILCVEGACDLEMRLVGDPQQMVRREVGSAIFISKPFPFDRLVYAVFGHVERLLLAGGRRGSPSRRRARRVLPVRRGSPKR